MADCSRRRMHAGTECIWNANNLLWPGRSEICIWDSLKGTCKMLPRINWSPLKFKETFVCLMLYLFCSCSEAAPASSSDTRGCWVVSTLWTSHRRFLHAVEPTRKQASSSRTSINKTSGALSKEPWAFQKILNNRETCTKICDVCGDHLQAVCTESMCFSHNLGSPSSACLLHEEARSSTEKINRHL